MLFIKKIAIFISILVIGLNSKSHTAGQDSIQEPLEILFIGSIYFNYNDLPGIFENLSDSSENEIYIDQQIRNGLYLEDHASSSLTESKINERKWDYVVLQGVGRTTAYPEIYTDHPVYPSLVKLRDKISANCVSTKMVFCLPWAYEDGMAWLAGWTDLYEDMQFKIYENTLQYSDDLGFVIAPVGWVWNKILKEKNYPLHYLHQNDWNHPSRRGSYVMACVIFTTIFQESSINNSYYYNLSEHDVIFFQTVASNIVLENFELWNIPATNIDIAEFSTQNKLNLRQNYPNPFNSSTNIKFELPSQNNVSVIVYNFLGNTVKTLVNKNLSAGEYTIQWNPDNCPSGLYFIRFKTDRYSVTRKIILQK
jgi:hypothetical protein